MKHFVNVYYQFMVAGFMQVANYLKHEIFNIKNKRSFVGAHFSKRSPNFLDGAVPHLLGFMWLTEGVVKIAEAGSVPAGRQHRQLSRGQRRGAGRALRMPS
ncbi:MAG: hypothetical protein R2881_11080 [Eubacteriales bacterium]